MTSSSSTEYSGTLIHGQYDLPLDEAGKAQARILAKGFKAKGGLTCLYMSDAKRTVQTAQAIKDECPELDMEEPTPDLRSWALGGLEGSPKTEANPKIESFIRYLPDQPPKGTSDDTGKKAESFDDFRGRVMAYTNQQLAEWLRNKKLKLGIMTHSKVIRLYRAWLKAGMTPFMDVDATTFMDESKKAVGNPGSVWLWAPDGPADKPWKLTLVDMRSDDPLVPGVYVIRHCETRINSQ